MTTSQRAALSELLELTRPVAELANLIHAFPYDYGGLPVVLTKAHLVHALHSCVNGRMTCLELENWADLIEGRPGIDFQFGAEEKLAGVLFKLSTPDINGPLTPQRCWELLKAL